MNWHERIKRARARGHFSDEDLGFAGRWPNCACGQQDPRIPREDGEPDDAKLFELGMQFTRAVDRDGFDAAERVLAAIEKRAQEVLAELGY